MAYTDSYDEVVTKNEYTVIPWDDPYPNINSTLSQDKQVQIKTLNFRTKCNPVFSCYLQKKNSN
jgi:hypothetical protein